MLTTAMTRVDGKCIKANINAFFIRFSVVFAKVAITGKIYNAKMIKSPAIPRET